MTHPIPGNQNRSSSSIYKGLDF